MNKYMSKNPSLAFWPKTDLTLFFTFLWWQNQIGADDLCQCTMVKLDVALSPHTKTGLLCQDFDKLHWE